MTPQARPSDPLPFKSRTWSVEHTCVAKVQPHDVFRYYTDPSTWHSWHHDTRWARMEGPYVEGATVLVRAGYGKVWTVHVMRVLPDRLVVNEVRPVGLVVINTFEVSPVDAGAQLRRSIEVSGRFARFYGLFLPRLYRRQLATETRRLVEAITADRPPS